MLKVIKKFNLLLNEKQKRKLFWLFVIMLIGAMLEVVGVSMLVPAINIIMNEDIMANNDIVKAVTTFLHIENYSSFVILSISALIVLFIVKGLFGIFQNYIQVKFVCDNRLAMEKRLLGIIIKRPYAFFLNVKSGEVIQAVIKDPNNVYNMLLSLLTLATDLIVSLALGITVFVIEPVMTLIVMATLVACMLGITLFTRPKNKKAGDTFRKCNSLMGSWVIQIVAGIKEIKITQKEEYFEKIYGEITGKSVKAEKTYKTLNGVPRNLIEMVSLAGALVALLIMIINGRSMDSLIPPLGAFAFAAIKLLPNTNKIAVAINDVAYQQPFLDKLIENLQMLESENANNCLGDGGNNKSVTVKESIELNNITFKYPSTERIILRNANMTIPVGKSVGIVGPSGAGKTTTVDVLLGLLNPESGEILADGKNVMDNYHDWLSNIGYIPQSIFLLDGSIRENVAFGTAEDVDDEKVWKALRESQLEEFVRSLPDGLDSMVGERGVKISGGQKQRMGIARALYSDPEVIVFDEATSSLDNETEMAIMESINSLHGKKTMIIIAHRLQTIEGCDMVYRVEDETITRER